MSLLFVLLVIGSGFLFAENQFVSALVLSDCPTAACLCEFADSMENINIWRAMEATLEADNVAGAPDSNSNDDNRRPRLTLPPMVIFSNLISRQLILISIFTILFNMVQLVCQVRNILR